MELGLHNWENILHDYGWAAMAFHKLGTLLGIVHTVDHPHVERKAYHPGGFINKTVIIEKSCSHRKYILVIILQWPSRGCDKGPKIP
jgi:hypothetical protein